MKEEKASKEEGQPKGEIKTKRHIDRIQREGIPQQKRGTDDMERCQIKAEGQ